MKAFRKIKALSPVISVLLLVIMAAVASVMLYVWFSGYFSTQATKVTGLTELSITVQRTTFTNYTDQGYGTVIIVASIYNPSDETVNITEIKVQINGQEITGKNFSLTPSVSASSPLPVLPGRAVTVAMICHIGDLGIDHGEAASIVIMASGTGVDTGTPYQATYAYSVTAP